MAYVSQEMKKAKALKIKEIAKKYGVKASLSVRHHMSLVCKISVGSLDFISNWNETIANDPLGLDRKQTAEKYINVNVYHYEKAFTGKCLDFMKELIAALNEGNHDNSDSMTDYHDVGFYVDVNIGTWEKPYELVA